MNVRRDQQLYEGKAKVLFSTDDPEVLIQYFKDDATAFNGLKKGQIGHKGVINCAIATHLFQLLEAEGIATHFLARISPREMAITSVQIVPLEVVVRNVVAGSLAKRMGLPEGQNLSQPIVELYYKRDDLNDPMVNDDHVLTFGLATEEELALLRARALEINHFLMTLFEEKGILLVDFKLEFGRTERGLVLADELSPDGARLWDLSSGEKLDKDRFRRDLGGVEEAYQEVLRRLVGEDAVQAALRA